MTQNAKKPVCEYDLPAYERYLAAQAAKGRRLTDWLEFSYEAVGQRCCFYLEGAEEKGGPSDTLLRRREAQGWDYVCGAYGRSFHVWRSRGETAHRPVPQAMERSAWCLRRLRRSIVLDVLALFLLAALLAGYLVYTARQPLWLYGFVTGDSSLIDALSTVVGAFASLYLGLVDLPPRLRLHRALSEGREPESSGSGTLRRVLSYGAVAVMLLLLVLEVCLFRSDYRSGIDVPFVAAEQLGGAYSPQRSCESASSLLLRTHIEASEGDYVFLDRPRRDGGRRLLESIKTTHLKLLRLRIPALARPLARELAAEYPALDLGAPAQALALEGTDAAYYLSARGVQYLILARGETVLLYRTDAPQPLYEHAALFLSLLEE